MKSLTPTGFGGICIVLLMLVVGCGAPESVKSNDVSSPPCNADSVPASFDGMKPGQLLDFHQVQPDEAFNGRIWRMLYVSTGNDESDLQAVCGTVVAPAADVHLANAEGEGKMAIWSHGTAGLQPRCQPSRDPNKFITGPTWPGLGAIKYGSKLAGNLTEGEPQDGILQTMANRGWVVAATDYYVGFNDNDDFQPYLVGKIEASNVLDSARAATSVLAESISEARDISKYRAAIWGHSQGGHSALWAAQLSRKYLSATEDGGQTPIEILGVAAEAPASNFVASSDDPDSTWGYHLGDWEMHQSLDFDLFGHTVSRTAIGIALFSNIVGAYSHVSRSVAPSGDAEFPAFPLDAGDLEQSSLLTSANPDDPGKPNGVTTAAAVNQLCMVNVSDALEISKEVSPYLDADENAFFVEPIWGPNNKLDPPRGRLDQTCAETSDAELAKWCRWLRYNMPGPDGENGFDKYPTAADGHPLPVLIATGEDDQLVHCVTSDKGIPKAKDCMASALYDSLKDVYCPSGTDTDRGFLRYDVWKVANPLTPSTHFSVAGQEANNGEAGFVGSELDSFMSALLDKAKLKPQCTASVVNADFPQ